MRVEGCAKSNAEALYFLCRGIWGRALVPREAIACTDHHRYISLKWDYNKPQLGSQTLKIESDDRQGVPTNVTQKTNNQRCTPYRRQTHTRPYAQNHSLSHSHFLSHTLMYLYIHIYKTRIYTYV